MNDATQKIIEGNQLAAARLIRLLEEGDPQSEHRGDVGLGPPVVRGPEGARRLLPLVVAPERLASTLPDDEREMAESTPWEFAVAMGLAQAYVAPEAFSLTVLPAALRVDSAHSAPPR